MEATQFKKGETSDLLDQVALEQDTKSNKTVSIELTTIDGKKEKPKVETLLRTRASKLQKPNSAEPVDSQECARKKKASTLSLFLKSLKFFTVVAIGALLISMIFNVITGASNVYVYFLIGLAVSIQATYYKFRVWMNPSYKPDCDCAQLEHFIPSKRDMMNGVFTVLDHKKSALLFNVPNTVFRILFYAFMIFINYKQIYLFAPLTLLLTLISCSGSIYLWYTMIVEVGSVCVLCSTIHAINFLTLSALVR